MAAPQQPQYSQAHLDMLARQLGFHDYATYSAYQAKQRAMQGPAQVGYGMAGAPQQAGPPQNWLQHLLSSIPATPAYLLGKVNDAFGGATR